MARSFTLVLAALFTLLGVLGFIPGVAKEGVLLGLFQVNTPLSLLHLLTGLVAFGSYMSELATVRYMRVVGVFYAVYSLFGFIYGNDKIFGIIANNMANNVLHIIVTIIGLYFGYALIQGAAKKTA